MPEALFECYQRMLESAVASEIASEIAGQVRDELSPAELKDAERVRRSVLSRLATLIPVCAEAGRSSRGADGRPLTIALVGPTGVGKTTTIAKLAATYRLKEGRRVGLITCDTYRIAAVDQLRTYAGIINIPLRVAMTPAEMRSACAAMADRDVILIDTAGRAPKDAARLGELRALIGAASPHQTHLVLSSSTAEASLLDAAERFAPLGCDRVILTKLDEAVSFGVVVNVLKRLNTRLSFVTTGQEVPDHIEAVTPDRLARLVMGAETLSR
jgi:flagellar biosynthesis protein FlhF